MAADKAHGLKGPTGLIVTTTRAGLHPETETRLLSVTLTDDPEQTRRILRMQARSRDLRVDLQPWHALQRYLELGPRDVIIPYADWLAECCDVSAVRLRSFAQLLRLIQAHALLHQEQRQKAPQGAVVATAEDYSAVYVLVADLVAEGVEATVSPRVREALKVFDN